MVFYVLRMDLIFRESVDGEREGLSRVLSILVYGGGM